MERKGKFRTGHTPPNKIILTAEQERFLLENYGTMTKVSLAKEFKVNVSTILEMMTRRGLKRTPEQLKNIIANKPGISKETLEDIAMVNRRIEGGGRGKGKVRWQLEKWILNNENFSTDKILVYKNKEEKYEDLILIKKSKYKAFVKEREKRLTLNSKLVIKQQIASLRKTSVIEKQKEVELQEKKYDEIKSTTPKGTDEAIDQLIKEDKVAIKIDSRTTVWVNRSKCDFVNGEWVRKKPLSIKKIQGDNPSVVDKEIEEDLADVRIEIQLKKSNILTPLT